LYASLGIGAGAVLLFIADSKDKQVAAAEGTFPGALLGPIVSRTIGLNDMIYRSLAAPASK
jgi:hypothetical protein